MTNSHKLRQLRNCLAAATILTINLAADSQARESFYNLRYSEPSVVVNLTALGELTPQATAAPVVSMQPVMSPAGPKLAHRAKAKQVARKKVAKPAAEMAKLPEVPPAKPAEIKEAKPVEVATTSAPAKLTEVKAPSKVEKPEPVRTVDMPEAPAAVSQVPPPITDMAPPPPPANAEALKPVNGNIGGKDKMVALPQDTPPESQPTKTAEATKTEKPKKPAAKPPTLPKVAEFSAGPLPTTLTEPSAVALPPAKPAEPAATEASKAPAASSNALPPVETVKSDSDKVAKQPPLELPPLASLNENKPAAKEQETASITMPEKPPAPPAPPAAETTPAKETVIVQPQELPVNKVPSSNASTLSIPYGEAEIELPPSEKDHLEDIVSKLNADKDSHVTVIAYASGTPDQTSQAKRTALARALAVRKYLMDRNINSERMDIRPLGNKASDGVPDRVDIFIDKTGRS